MTPSPDLLAVLREAFEAGYIQGHDATVEGRYADPSDAAQDYVRTLLAPTVDERAASSEAAVAFDAERFERAPCYLCGYNGRGYYQPETHPCAAKYHAHPAPLPTVAGVTEDAVDRMAFWLCARDGVDEPHALEYQGNPPEPYGEAWMRYRGDARAALEAALARAGGK